ncbi:MAG: FkbM family methyltransferase [Xanthobacteraceae bacterium]|nr:MAG: FkbM family methyltransferase [Xanthobacteraceae bacterium]
MALPPIDYDRATGVLTGASMLERCAALAFKAGARASSAWSHRGFGLGCQVVRTVLPPRDIKVMLNDDAAFTFPYGDGYWSLLLDSRYHYERDIERFFLGIADADYTLIDCGANFGYWSVLASSRPYGAHRAIAIEPSSQNFSRLTANARLNGDRFTALQRAIGAARGTARLSGHKHEQFSIAGNGSDGEEVAVIALDHLIDDGRVPAAGRYVIKLDVEGVEIDAIKGGRRLLATDSILVVEDHGQDRAHTVSRYILEQTPLKLFMHDPLTGRFEKLARLDALDRIKQHTNVGYNVLATASPFWEQRIHNLGAAPARAER